MEYPRKLYANVLLLDGKIINWKTGDRSWGGRRWATSRQPLNLIICNGEAICEERLQSEVFCVTVFDDIQWNNFFEYTSKEFYKMYEIHESYSKSMFRPY